MMNWSEVDGALLRESIKLAKSVRDSIEAQVNIDEIIRQWNLSYREGSEVTTAEARAWAKVNVVVNNTELNKGLGILYAIGWMLGRDVATSAYAHARLNKAAPTDDQLNGLLNIDWANWKPGNNPGALLAAPPGGLKGLLQRRGLDLQGLTNTLLNRIGTQLANALTSGAADTTLGKALEAIVGDPERALTIANTSMASAMSVSTRETYQEFGLAKMRWLALEPCETCSGNGAMGPVTPGEAVFKNVQGDNITEPPAHPNCRCALSPVIDLDQFKYVGQARDERGRWSSGGAGGAQSLTIPSNPVVSQSNLVSATAPYVGLSDKAQSVAARIQNVNHMNTTVDEDGFKITTYEATYESEKGKKFDLRATETIEPDLLLDGVITATTPAGEKAGELKYESVSSRHIDLPIQVSRISFTGVFAEFRSNALATAMLEFARKTSTTPVLHSNQLTDEGREFAESTKTVEQ